MIWCCLALSQGEYGTVGLVPEHFGVRVQVQLPGAAHEALPGSQAAQIQVRPPSVGLRMRARSGPLVRKLLEKRRWDVEGSWSESLETGASSDSAPLFLRAPLSPAASLEDQPQPHASPVRAGADAQRPGRDREEPLLWINSAMARQRVRWLVQQLCRPPSSSTFQLPTALPPRSAIGGSAGCE